MNQTESTARSRAVEEVRRYNDGKRRKYYVVTLGCQQNEADGEKIRGMAEEMGYFPAERPEDASLIVVNTCAVRRHAELKALSLVGTYKHIREGNPETLIGVCGCMAAEPEIVEKLKREFHYVSFTLEPNRLFRLPELVARAIGEHRRTFLLGEDDGTVCEGLPTVRSSRHRAWVSIMYGCNNFCSYCIVPYVRGRERSRESGEVLAECRALVADGVKEITLLGQNVNSYRADISFPELLARVAEIPGDFLVRFMTSHPKDVSDDLIRVMRDHREKIAPAFHLPLQSGSDRILHAMNRTYTSAHYLEIADKLRAAIPDITLTSDIIVAFPGEEEADFEDTLRVMERVRYDAVYSFIFSPREGTRAAKMENLTTAEEKNDRMARLLALQREISLEKNLCEVGKTVRVLCDGEAREGGYLGRTPGGKLVRFTAPADPTGTFVRVKIDRATPFDLFGTAI
ncbi:MAG TPA: tRNA (N6-isopentenyl adenosine(37)-C2)-methylthiotransferase MiaB [Clostridiales bacterium]|nr:tRNA (N6-isopentenyl adenosine(37)-C2)-methylthiotransferase MiaB [Clostridiales bacterium]